MRKGFWSHEVREKTCLIGWMSFWVDDVYLNSMINTTIIWMFEVTRDRYVQPLLFQPSYLCNLCGELSRVSLMDDGYSHMRLITAITIYSASQGTSTSNPIFSIHGRLNSTRLFNMFWGWWMNILMVGILWPSHKHSGLQGTSTSNPTFFN